MAKKEKVLDVKSKVEKITEQHLKELQNVVNTVNGMQFNIGRIEMQKHNLLHDLATAHDRIALMQEKMTKEYGSYDINLTDGTINWPKDEK